MLAMDNDGIVIDGYTHNALRVWKHAKLKIRFGVSDGSTVFLTLRKALDLPDQRPVIQTAVVLKDLLTKALFVAFGNPAKLAANVSELEQAKGILHLYDIKPGMAEIDAKIAMLKTDVEALNVLKVLGNYPPQRAYVHALCEVWLAITGDVPRGSDKGPFVRFIMAVTKYMAPEGTQTPSRHTIWRARNEWEQPKGAQ